MDEILQMLWKLPTSKRALRSYYLPEEEQRQIQMVTALLIQLVHRSANLPEALRQVSSGNSILEVSIDCSYPTKCHEAATEACCLFWTRVLQRFATLKTQDVSEMKVMMENLVMDLLTTLNLPEYPASAQSFGGTINFDIITFVNAQGCFHAKAGICAFAGSVCLATPECWTEI